MRPRLAFPCGLLAAAVSCTGNDPALLANVHVDTSSQSRCVVLVATGQGGSRGETAPLGVEAGQVRTVAVFQKDLGTDVTLQAMGYIAPDCSSIAPDELSEQSPASFQPGKVPPYDLTLLGEGDCDDELDGDHDELTDCEDPACSASASCIPDGGPPMNPFPYQPSNFDPLAIGAPDASLVIDCDAGYDTGTQTGWLCGRPLPAAQVVDGGKAGPLVLLAVNDLTITDAGAWHIQGRRPLVVAVFGNASIDGPLLGGADGGNNGPGAGRAGCAGTGYDGKDGGNGGGGGGGGGHGQPGAPGSCSAGTQAPGGDGGVSFGNPELVPLLAGCPGGPGGVEPTTGLLRPEGGGGGGSLQLSAVGTVRVSSAIGVSGGGGRGCTVVSNSGGGGGGSGGAILLEARQLVFAQSARVTANGGGGGEGCDGTIGHDGEDGRIDGPFPARGGYGSSFMWGGDGGTGTLAATSGTFVIGGNFGGAGGGGGVGRIRLNALERCTFGGPLDQTLSPRATSNLAGDAGCP